jgi:hypothetical protein
MLKELSAAILSTEAVPGLSSGRMKTPDRFASLISLARRHFGDAAAGEVFLALEGAEPETVTESWRESFRHPDREAASAVEHACASRWADSDLPGMAKAVFLELRSSAAVVTMAAALLSRLTHDEAWELLITLPGETESFRFDYLTALASTEPGQALALLPPLKRGFHGGTGRESVIRAATSAAPGLVADWLKQTGADGSDAQAAAGVLAKSDPPSALRMARWLAEKGLDYYADNISAAIFRGWAEKEPKTAGRELIAWLGGTDSRTPVTSWYTGLDFKPATASVFYLWAAADPEEALAGACSLSQEHLRCIALNSVGLGWPVPEAGMHAARELPLADRLAFLELLAQSLAQTGPDILRAELDSLPIPDHREQASILRDCWRQLSNEDARNFEKKAPELFETEPKEISPMGSNVFSSLQSPEAPGKSLAQVRATLDQSPS